MAFSIKPKTKVVAVSIEPEVYVSGKFGVRVEDIVMVTEGGHRRLTGLDHELIINA